MLKKCNLLLLIVLVALLSGCNDQPSPAPPVRPVVPTPSGQNEPQSVADMLPKLEDAYHTVEGQTLTGFLGTTSEGVALLAGRPDLAAAIEFTDGMIDCYQDEEAVRGRLYISKAYALSAGAVAIGDRNELLSPENLFNCLLRTVYLERSDGEPAKPKIEPCSHRYTIQRDGNEFYIVYAATTADVCQDICTNLEGCTEHTAAAP